ncbi:MAG TPA: hypothetical protein PKY82_25335, partial [Pyrinomonadaceae bacterium]|nr:hypothetical protein [Pyrinomonadaceae bacterium]
MRFHTRIVLIITFVIGLFHNFDNFYQKTWLRFSRSFIIDNCRLSQRILAAVLLLAMVLPMIFFGQIKTVSANPISAAPPVELPAVLTAPPQPFQLSSQLADHSYQFSRKNIPLLFNVWDDLSGWFNSEPQSGCPSGFTSLGGIITSDPTASVFANKIFVFIRGTDGSVYYQTFDGSSFAGWFGLGGVITSNPASTVSNSTLYFEATGTDNNRYKQTTTDGVNFSGWQAGGVTNTTNPSVSYSGQTYTFVKGTGSQPPLCYQAVTPTPTPTPTITPTPTPAPPNSTPTQTATTLPTSTNLSRVRLAPVNQTGGTSLYSRNFGWGTGLAGLSGRGLDAGFGISYNSLIWTRVGNDVVFNPNNDNVTPGFRFGFPVIEPSYSDPVTNKNTYLMVTPSGGRVEFRQVTGSSDTFETADSSYVQLKVLDANNLQLTGTDGTNAFYQLKNGAFRCQQIKDSNGNYITIDHDTNGLLQSVTDTLGRVISVSYDAGGQPIAITQSRSTGTFTFAGLSYTNLTLSTNFSGLNLVGITNGATIKVLNKITYADGSHADFDYNSYGQVWKVSNYAADNHKLNHVATNLDSVSGAQTDVPRWTEMRNWTENFNLDNSNVAQEVVIPIVYQENAGFILPNGSTVAGTLLHVTAPDGTISKTFVGGTGSGWMEGLPVLTEDWANESGNWNRKRWSYSAYTQDDVNLGYILNPRTIESKIGDVGNVRRTTMEYWTQSGNSNAALYGLVKEVKVFDADQTTVLKRSTIDYNLDSNYLNRRIIGLPAKSELYDQANVLMAKVTYGYDEGNFSGTGQTISAVQHDATNYGAGFSYRGNSTSTTKWDVTDPNNGSKAISNSVKYNITGNPVSALDPLNREIKMSYTDNFDESPINRNTFAYPTQITDPAGNSSTVKYRYDFGANVYAQSPAPAGQSEGKKTQRIYDSLGRLEKEIVVNTGAYTRYEYPTNGIQLRVFTTITDVNNNGADSTDEVLSESFSDGAGRTRQSRTEHPNSAGGWSGTLAEYDIMGRVKRSTVPTEINSSWQPSGDDA